MNRPSQVSDSAWQIQTLADSAKHLAERGELQEAERIYLKILETAPYHVRSLNFLAVQAMARGDLDASQHYLDQALRAAPDRAILHQNMGLVQKERGNLDAALEWMNRAIVLKPEHPSASLHKGAILQQLGRMDEAVSAYRQGWRYFPNPEKTANDIFSAPAVRDLLMQAAASIRNTQWRLIEEHLAPVLDRYGAETLTRVTEAADVYLGRRPASYQHALQRPSFLYLPDLAPQAFFDNDQFPWVDGLKSATAVIRAELEAALSADQGFAPYVKIEEGQDPQQWRELDGSRTWSALHLYKAGTRVDDNCKRCPQTAAVVESLQLPTIPGHAPEALFSVLQAGTYIPPHFGLANYKLVAHLPLVVPPDCAIRVGNETRSWDEGECLIFDDSFQHEAWNRSSERRAVLILDVWHPQVTQAEREGIAALVSGVAAFNRG